MEAVTLILRSEVDEKPIRYNVKVTKEVAEKYTKIKAENPKLDDPEALSRAKK